MVTVLIAFMRKHLHFKIMGVLLMSSISSWSQTATPNISDFSKVSEVLPPSPDASSLGKYGGMDMSLASGSASINIPVWNYTSIDLSSPVSLSYSSTGFRVDELPGRVGTGWALNAGGVITRTVYGGADELSQRLATPPDFPARSAALLEFMEGLASSDVYGPLDAQPDLFSFNFNGNAGRFILDANLNPILLSHSNLKIEKDFLSTSWNFKITSAEGIQYFFGGESALEKTKKISAGTSCGKSYAGFIPTAWYLKKIIHPNNDEIEFIYEYAGSQYTTGISESIYKRSTEFMGAACPGWEVTAPTLNNTLCETILQTGGVRLTEINSTGGSKLKFIYSDRNDCNDKLLTSVEVYQPGQSATCRIFSFSYEYAIATNFKNSFSTGDSKLNFRPFLTSFIEKSSDGLLTKQHGFSYNDINSLPPRLSYAQDDYGFFNGKNNSTLIPEPLSLRLRQELPSATANRKVDPVFCQKGLLSKIKYPTAGEDVIIYEANQVYEEVKTYPSQTSVSASATNEFFNGGVATTNFSTTANIGFSQEATLSGNCISNSTGGGDPLHDKTIITFLDEYDNVVYTIAMRPGDNFSKILDLTAGRSYRIKTSSYGDNVTGGATLLFMGGQITTQNMNVNTGGVRVATVTSTDANANVSSIKQYYYSKLLTPLISSGGKVYAPQYEKFLKVYVPCMSGLSTDPQNPAGNVNCNVTDFTYYSMYSNTLNNIYVYPSAPVSYGSVIESFGENFENGGIEHHYTVFEDIPSDCIVGSCLLLGAPLTSFAWKNARETYQYTFKINGMNDIAVRKVFTNYNEDTRIDQDIKAYVVNKKYTAPCQETIPSDIEIDAYDLLSYSYFVKWVYVDNVKTRTYDINGQNYLEQESTSEYANTSHALPTRQTNKTSDGKSNIVTNFYPQDITLSGSEETARLSLVSKHMIGNVLQQQVNKDAIQLFTSKTSYSIFPSGLVLPQSGSVQKTGFSLEERIKYYSYNEKGKLLEQSKKDDIRQSYLWGYNNMYPVAEVINSSINNIFHTSFEDTEGTSIDGDSKTGRKSRTGGYTKSLSDLTNGQYILSYWQKSGSTWDLQISNVTVSGNAYTINLAGQVDEIRFMSASALMTTYTYDPLIGMTSKCDANNIINYYEYDGLGRLSLVRDQDKNILKKLCYNYAGQPEQCGN